MIVLIDNYDSFTYNLVHYVEQFAKEVVVIQNDAEYESHLNWADKIILSPGPGLPQDSGKLMEIIKNAVGKLPTLGVCLGHQALGIHFGGELVNLKKVHHGKQSELYISNSADLIFKGISSKSMVGHYHSWVIEKTSLPKELELTSTSLGGEIMSLKHKELPIWGVQFHPESVLTENGIKMIENWVLGK